MFLLPGSTSILLDISAAYVAKAIEKQEKPNHELHAVAEKLNASEKYIWWGIQILWNFWIFAFNSVVCIGVCLSLPSYALDMLERMIDGHSGFNDVLAKFGLPNASKMSWASHTNIDLEWGNKIMRRKKDDFDIVIMPPLALLWTLRCIKLWLHSIHRWTTRFAISIDLWSTRN